MKKDLQKNIEICEQNGWHIDEFEGYIYLSRYSDAGEDFGFFVSEENFIDDIKEYAECFDEELYATIWSRISVEDAKSIKKMLIELANALTRDSEELCLQEQDIFKTLEDYNHGFYSTAKEDEIKVYNNKVDELKRKILNNVEHAPEIIAEAFAKFKAIEYRCFLKDIPYGDYTLTGEEHAEYKAIENVLMALGNSKPLA